jgi:hypothetical protein
MRRVRRLAIILTIEILAYSIAWAQGIHYLGSTLWNEARDIEVSGDYAYCAFANGLAVYDISVPDNAMEIGKTYLQGFSCGIFIRDTLAFLSSMEGGLNIVNISNPHRPFLVGNYMDNSQVFNACADGGYAYIVGAYNGFQIIDISNLSEPREIARMNNLNAIDVIAEGDYAYIASNASGLTIVNIADKANPVITAECGNGCISLAKRDSLIFTNFCDIINIARPDDPILIYSYQIYSRDIKVNSNYLYLTYFHNTYDWGFYIYDISDLFDPVYAGNFHTASHPHGIFIAGNTAFISEQYHLEIVSVSAPSSPTLISRIGLPARSYDVSANTQYAFIANDTSGMQVLDCLDPSNPIPIANTQTPRDAKRIKIKGNYAFLTDDSHGPDLMFGLFVYDISNPSLPIQIDNYYTTDISYSGIAISGNHLYLGGFPPKISVLDISNPSSVFLINTLIVNSPPSDISIRGNFAFLASGRHIEVLDLARETVPQLIGSIGLDGNAEAIDVYGNYAYVARGERGLAVLDVSNPCCPLMVDGFSLGGLTREVIVSGHYAIVGTDGWEGGRIDVFDLSAAPILTHVDSYSTPGLAHGFYADNGLLYCADGFSLIILDCPYATSVDDHAETPTSFYLSPAYPNPFNSSTMFEYSLPQYSYVRLEIFDIVGRNLCVIAEGLMPAGIYKTVWQAKGYSSGIYFARLITDESTRMTKIVLLK